MASPTDPTQTAVPPRSGRPTSPGPTTIRWWPIALAVVLAVAAMGGALVYFGALFSGQGNSQPPPSGCGPCGAVFAVGAPVESGRGTSWTYTMTMAPTSGVTSAQLSFEVESSSGAHVELPSASVVIEGPNECQIAENAFSTAAWSNGPTSGADACSPAGTAQTLLSSSDVLVLWTGSTNLRGLGDRFVIDLASGGSVITALP